MKALLVIVAVILASVVVASAAGEPWVLWYHSENEGREGRTVWARREAFEDKATCLAGAGKHVRSLEEVMVPALGTDGHFHYDDKGTWFAIFTYKDKPWVVHVDLSCWPSSVDPRK
jgi:hypothetical protein